MQVKRIGRAVGLIGLLGLLAGCGGGGLFGNRAANQTDLPQERIAAAPAEKRQSSFFDLFNDRDNPNTTVEVNKYIWQAALEVLDFLPKEQVDPFSGVIVTGYGTPPGGGRAYRATVLVNDPALDARSLKVSLESRGGAVSAETARAVEDAILTRARQLRIRDSRL